MKTKEAILCLTIGGLLAGVEGCGKTEKSDTASNGAEQTIRTDKPSTAMTAEKLVEQPRNPLVPGVATDAVMAVKAPDAAVAPVKTAVVALPSPASDKGSEAVGLAATNLAGLSQDQIVRGLEEALASGLQQAIARLGHEGGFLTNLNVRIPMPDKLQKVETALRVMKQDKLADDFVATMNHAAEQAVPEAGVVFADTLKQMTIEDAKSILNGPNDAATQYFQKTTQTNLYARFYPIVQKATEKTGVTAAYKKLMEKANVTKSLGSFGSALGGALLDKDSIDVDAYVTTKAMEGLFKMVAEEENRIRQNPMARTTDILQKVFGALKK